MSFLFCLYHVLFISLLSGTNASSSTSSLQENTSGLEAKSEPPKLVINSEGGLTVVSTPTVKQLTDNASALLSLDRELGKDKSSQPEGSKVKPRKGVVFDAKNSTTVEIHQKELPSVLKKEKNETSLENYRNSSAVKESFNDTLVDNTSLHKVSKKIESVHKTTHKKPLFLSNEGLDKMVYKTVDLNIPAMQSSPKSDVVDQILSPNNGGPRKKIQPMSASRHPGMIMPVVITILVVPMFAVLGYMALQRGQEAWRNRRYKRMDFLLDGMYNE